MAALWSTIHEIFLLCISLLCPEHTPGGYLVSADISRVLKSLPEPSFAAVGQLSGRDGLTDLLGTMRKIHVALCNKTLTFC